MDQKKIGRFICNERKRKGLTQEKLAEMLAISNKSISRWENGVTLPDYSNLKLLCDILEVSANEILEGERIAKDDVIVKYEENIVELLKAYTSLKRQRNIFRGILLAVVLFTAIILTNILLAAVIFQFMNVSYETSQVSVITDKGMYENVIGESVDEEYRFKIGEHEEIFPDSIDGLTVSDFQMVYYNPWDPQYLAYLVVEYGEDEYQKEIQRLTQIGIDDYQGEYGTTGFGDSEVAALKVVDYHRGMIYALYDDEMKTITYVELFFCNFFYDLDYKNYIDNSLLPEGFDATKDNIYIEKYLQDIREEQRGNIKGMP